MTSLPGTPGGSSKVDDIRRLIINHSRRLQRLKEQQALRGISVDPGILLEIEDIETQITALEAELELAQKQEAKAVTVEKPLLAVEIKKNILRAEQFLESLLQQHHIEIDPKTRFELELKLSETEAEIERLRTQLRQVAPEEEEIELVPKLASGQISFTPETYARLINLSRHSSPSVRQEMLRAIRENYSRLPKQLRRLVHEFADDRDDTIRADVATWILRNYNSIGEEYEPVLRRLAQEESVTVRQTIVSDSLLVFEQLPSRVRALVSHLIGAPNIEVKIIKGSGMLVAQPSDLVLKVTNKNETGSEVVDITIQPSADYEIIGSDSFFIPELRAGQSKEAKFQLKMREPQRTTVNYTVNGELKEPALSINAVKDNPYVYGDPIKEELTFYGRQKVLDRIIQAVTKPTKQDILIVGERRTGKTSLFYQLQKLLNSPFIPVYIVLNTIEPKTEAILETILRKIIRRLVESEILEKGWLEKHFAYTDFVDNVREAIEAAKANLRDIRIILLIDEADYLLNVKPKPDGIQEWFTYRINTFKGKPPIDERLQNVLRAALQSEEVGADLRAVVAGTSDLSTYVSRRASPFFNHFRFEPLKPLTIEETHQLITEPASTLGYTYLPIAVEHITSLCGGQPYYCQAICYESFDHALGAKRRDINNEDVSIAETKITEDLFNSYRSGFWDRTNKEEKLFLSALARNVSVNNFTRAQMKRLIDWQLITEIDGQYDFSSQLVKKWTVMATQR